MVTSVAMILNNIFRKRAQKPVYRYEDFLEDLKNPAVPIDQVIEKCGGKIPREWEERISPAPEKAVPGPLPAAPVDEDRAQARKDWFNKLADSTPVIPVVPAPIPPRPVPTIKGWIIHCKWCTDVGAGQSGRRVEMTPGYHYGQYGVPGVHVQKRYMNTCQYCGGKGMVMITGG